MHLNTIYSGPKTQENKQKWHTDLVSMPQAWFRYLSNEYPMSTVFSLFCHSNILVLGPLASGYTFSFSESSLIQIISRFNHTSMGIMTLAHGKE